MISYTQYRLFSTLVNSKLKHQTTPTYNIRQNHRNITLENKENQWVKIVLVKQPVASAKEIWIILTSSIIDMNFFFITNLQITQSPKRLKYQNVIAHSQAISGICVFTFNFSWASWTVLPSFFFFQLWPSLRKFLTTLRSYSTMVPPTFKENYKCD